MDEIKILDEHREVMKGFEARIRGAEAGLNVLSHALGEAQMDMWKFVEREYGLDLKKGKYTVDFRTGTFTKLRDL